MEQLATTKPPKYAISRRLILLAILCIQAPAWMPTESNVFASNQCAGINRVTLGNEKESVHINDGLSPPSVPSVLESDLNCDNGDVVTSIFYKEADSGNYQESVDAIGIGCSPLLEDGTIDFANEEDKKISGDFSGNSSNEERVTCPAGSAASVVKYKGVTYASGPSDHTDGITITCRSVSNAGVGSVTAQPPIPSETPGNPQSTVVRTCDNGSLLTGITYDHFNPNRNEKNHPVDLVDSVALFRCKPVLLECQEADIRIFKRVDDTTLTGGSGVERIRYTIEVDNVGQVDLTGIEVRDDIPNGATYIDGSSDSRCDQSGNTVVCTESTIDDGRDTEFELVFEVDTDVECGNTISNRARITTDQTGSANTNTVQTVVSDCPVLDPDLKITKTGPSTINAGDPITYNISVKNEGAGAAFDVRVYDFFIDNSTFNRLDPPPFTFVSSTGANCSYVSQNAYVSCDLGNIAAGVTKPITITFSTPANQFCGQSIMNQADAHLNNGQGTPASDWDKHQVTVNCPSPQTPNLTVTKTADRSRANIGDVIVYTVRVNNTGNAEALNVKVADALISELTFRSDRSDNDCGTQNNEVICGPVNIAAGGFEEFEIGFEVSQAAASSCGDIIYNRVEASADNASTVQSPQEDVEIDCGNPVFTISKTDNESTIQRNETLTYRIPVTNISNANARDIEIIDTLPQHVTYLSSNNGGSFSNGRVRWEIDINGLQTKTLEVRVRVNNNGVPDNFNLYNTVRITGGPSDNDSTRVVDANQCSGTNRVTLGSVNQSVRIGDSLSPPSVPSVLESNLNCDNGDVVTSIFYKEADSGNFQESVDAIGIGCSPLLEDGTVDSGNEEDKFISGDFSGNSSNEERVTCPAGSAASVVKYKGLTYRNGLSDHTDGLTITCRSVNNNGVGSITAQPPIPSETPGNPQNTVVRTCDNGSLLTGITYDHFNPNRNAGNHPVDLVDSLAIFRCKPVLLQCIPQQDPDLKITKTGPSDITAGQNVTYNISVKNEGNGTANDVRVYDFFIDNSTFNRLDPPPFTFVSSTGANCSYVSQNAYVSCDLGNIAAGVTKPITITFSTPANQFCGQNIMNQADAHLNNGQGTPASDWDKHQVRVNCPVQNPDLVVRKIPRHPSKAVGEQIKFTVRIDNNGSGPANNVVVTDVIPAGLDFKDSLTTNDCSLNPTTNTLTCGTFNIPAGTTKYLELFFTVNDQAPCGGSITNTARVNGTGFSEIIAQGTLQIEACADLQITKSGPINVNAGQNVTYGIFVKNNGNGTANNVRVFDFFIDNNTLAKINPPFTFVSSTGASCSYDSVNRYVTCNAGNIAPGVTKPLTITFSTPANQFCGQNIMNQADAHINNGQATAASDWDKHQVTVNCPITNPQLSVSKTANRDDVDIGDEVIYTIRVNNTGNATALNVNVFDEIINELAFRSHLSDNLCRIDPANNEVVCGSVSIPAGGFREFQIGFEVTQYAVCGSTIYNQVEATASNSSPVLSNSENIRVVCQTGCIEIIKEAFEPDGDMILPVPQFTFMLDGANQKQNSGNGIVRYDNVSIGTHQVSEIVPATWNLLSITPVNGILNVQGGSSCAVAVFKNQQVLQSPTFTISKTDNKTSVRRNELLTYEILVQNTSSVDDAPIEVIDTLPQNVTYVSSNLGGTPSNGTVRWVLDLDGGESEVLEVTVRVNDSNVPDNFLLFNRVQITNGPSATDTTIVVADPIQFGCVEIIKEAFEPDGDMITPVPQFTFMLDGSDPKQNSGNGLVRYDNVPVGSHTVSEIVPATWNLVSITPSNGVLQVQAGSNCAVAVFKNQQVLQPPVLSISKTVNKPFAEKNETLEYEIRVTNSSPNDALGVAIVDDLPADVRFISADSGGVYDSFQHRIEWNFPVDKFTTVELKVVVQIEPNVNAGDILKNTACIGSSICASASTEITAQPPVFGCVEIIKEAFEPDGDMITPVPQFTFMLDGSDPKQNSGNGLVRYDNVPVGSHTVSEIVPPTWNLLSITPNNGVLQVQAGSSCAVAVFKNQQVLQNPVFTIAKTDNESTVRPTETLTYEITVSNISDIDATNVEVIDTLPQNVTYVSSNFNGSFADGKVTWTIDLNDRDTKVLEVEVTVDNGTPNNFFLYNNAAITGGPDTDDVTKVVVDPIAEGCIDVKKETFTQDGTRLTPVTQFTFTLDGGTQTVLNNSNGDARFTNVPVGTHTVTEVLPTGWTQENVTPTDGNVTVLAGSNCVTVTFKNKQAAVGTPRFTISKTDNEATAEPEDTLTYRMEIKNISNVDATNVEVTDRIPDDVDFISASDSGSKSGNTVTWFFDLEAGETETFEMRVKVDEDADDGDVIFNEVKVKDGPTATDTTRIEDEDSDDDDDNDDSDDEDSDDDDDDDEIRVTINDDPDPIDFCNDDDLEYEIRLTNSSNSNEEVDVIALLDSDTSYQSSSDGGKERSGDRVEWEDVKVSRNSNRTLRLRVRVQSGAGDGDTLRLRVGVSDGDEDTEVTRVRNSGCDSDDDNFSGQPDLTIDKSANTTESLPGSAVSYTITIRNTGGSDVLNATLTDEYPGQFIDITDTGGGIDAGGRLTWNLGTLRSNSTTVVRYNARLKQGLTRGTSIRNTATIRSGSITRSDDHVIVVPTPPQTGLGGFIKSLTQNDSYLSDDSVASDTSRMVAVRPQARVAAPSSVDTAEGTSNNLPIVVWITTMLTGLGVGGMFGRRFLF